MLFIKRMFLFLTLNILIVMTISMVLSLFGVQPYLAKAGINYYSLAIFCLLWGMIGAFISLALSKKMAKWIMGVRTVDSRSMEYTFLVPMVQSLAEKASIPLPEIGIYSSKEMNAFATGPTKKDSLIAVSTGLIEKMSHDEIEGVLAHEIAHIKNGDMVTMTLLQGVVNAFVMFLARALAYAVSGLGREDKRGSYMTYFVCVYLFEISFMILGSLVVAGFSRYREYRADKGGAQLAGKHKMISALQALSQRQARIEAPVSKEKAAFSALQISSARSRSYLQLFASHPPLEERIARLQKM